MKWNKLGMIFCPFANSDWMNSHAAVPFAQQMDNELFKIYFTTRDKGNRSHTGYVIVNITNPRKILDISASPVLRPGLSGEFDDRGAMGCWLVKHHNLEYMYYQGWNLGVTVPFRNSIGLATSDDGSNFSRYASGPILDRLMFEPHFTATSCVLFENNTWKIWYLSCTEWLISDGKPKHKYHIKYAESDDGIHWDRKGIVAVDYANDSEYAISRPSVIHDKGCWKMWYSYRGASYRIGYAVSKDGINWHRLDNEVGIDVSSEGWDSEMIEYPFVFDYLDRRYMLYNGNDYGKTGFGLAVLVDA